MNNWLKVRTNEWVKGHKDFVEKYWATKTELRWEKRAQQLFSPLQIPYVPHGNEARPPPWQTDD
jgi:hypothetical protein